MLSAFLRDLVIAAERKQHTRLGSRLDYEMSGISSLFRQAGRDADDVGEIYVDRFVDLDEAWEDPATWTGKFAAPSWLEAQEAALAEEAEALPDFELRRGAAEALPRAANAYAAFAQTPS